MRLLYLTPTSAMGGAERVLLDLLTILKTARPEWHFGLIVGNEGPLSNEARALGVETTVLPFPRDFAQLGDAGLGSPRAWLSFVQHATRGSAAMVRYTRRLTAAIERFGPDIVHSNGIKMHVLGAVAKPSTASLVWHFHDYLSARPVTSRLVRSLHSRCGAIIAVSNHVAKDIRSTLGSSANVNVVWNSVDLARFSPHGPVADLADLSGLPPAPPGTVNIGLVATFAWWKGHRLFLDMLKRLSSTHIFRAYIVGGPLYETHASQLTMKELREEVEARGLQQTVGLTGFVTEPAAALRGLDVVVHASTMPEPFGLAVAEAMTAGCSVVISDTGGVAELVDPGRTGFSYRSTNVEDMTRRVRQLLDDPGLRHQLSAAAHEAASTQFNPDRVSAQILDLYATVTPERVMAHAS